MDPKEPEQPQNAPDAAGQVGQSIVPPQQDFDQEAKRKNAATPPMVGGATGEDAAASDAAEPDTRAEVSDFPGQEALGGPQEVAAQIDPSPDGSQAPIELSANVVDAYQGASDDVAPLDGLESDTAPDSSPVEIDTDPFVAPDDGSSDVDTSPFNKDDADLRSETGTSSLDLVNPAADAMTFEISMGADLSSDAPVEDATFRGGVYISGRDAEGPVEVPFPARDGFNETQSGMPSATSADVPADFARPIGWNAGGGHTDVGTSFGSAGADAGSSRVEVSVSVRMSREELERISAVAARVAAESSERAIEKRFFDLRTEQFQRDAQLRACWGR